MGRPIKLHGVEGWQLDDNNRSSWDILWACLSTILANRDESKGMWLFYKLLGWILAILAPEIMRAKAIEDLF
ncbi:hypothetical protein N7532_011313 [Penicillium argentinense]|uniref:Uncharacterized protein n=1 Tax=Penicillium argentinense TaxID=1131581 RepID=A0A9W9EIE1_9EURO|nr:uncharacterized protein N7532_011313 [Penicillium argentinense]KAJ5082270.1 hypothetical protein N7532_011313 [Penicillium argentinense]